MTAGCVLDVAQFFLERRLDFRKLAVFKQRLVGRIDDDDAVVAVEQRVIAGLQFLAGLDAREQIASGPVGKRRASEQERPLRRRDDAEDRIGGGIVQRDGRRRMRRLRPGDVAGGDRRVEQIGRQAEMHRAGPAGTRDADRFRHIGAERRR